MMDVEKYGVVGLLFVAGILALVLFYGPDEEPEIVGTELKSGSSASTQAGAQRAPRPGGASQANFEHASAAPRTNQSPRTVSYELGGVVDGSTPEPFDFSEQSYPSYGSASTPPASGRCTYVIESGDILGKIAERELGSSQRVKDLLAWNPKLDPLALQVGQVIRLCPPGADAPSAPVSTKPANKPAPKPTTAPATTLSASTYTVQPGDVLGAIASKQLGSIKHVDALFQANRHLLKDPDALAPGMELKLPKVGKLAGNN